MDDQPEETPRRNGFSLGTMLVILLIAIVAAGALAYLVVSPFFHQHPH